MDGGGFAAQELCPGGVSMICNCKDKEAYVSCLIQSHFVTSIAKQVSLFAQGFDSVSDESILQLLSSTGLELEDLNHMLRGNRNAGHVHEKRKSVGHNCDESSDSLISRHRLNIKNWQRGQLLGRGSFGSVYEVLAGEGTFFAVEEVPLVDDTIVHHIEQEIALLCQLSHQNIVEFVGTEKDESNLYIFFELVRGGSLEKVYQTFELDDSLVSLYTKQLIEGLKYLHDRNIIHRDIKCANILVDDVRIADFGLSKVIKLIILTKSCWGTLNWMAPEVLNPERGGYGVEADIWSLGCTVLEMLTRKIPYFDLERAAVQYSIGKGKLPQIPDTLSRHSRDFILQCLQVNPSERPTAAELLDHPFVKESSS
ncbi:mitogen-activated protein kinase kinase kinase 1-like [Ricinus communis]|uniref:Mitogen-activated protein kinase kinase kinase n=1 Tax=Ricinus communis TaxID=3988 RepID=B9SPD3_RICCO|nr:mitogen-activated protein kinase kinase kinase 1-like [Ricinus communis]EEF34555.1 conserved hypothetical protein [Ricinus communis]